MLWFLPTTHSHSSPQRQAPAWMCRVPFQSTFTHSHTSVHVQQQWRSFCTSQNINKTASYNKYNLATFSFTQHYAFEIHPYWFCSSVNTDPIASLDSSSYRQLSMHLALSLSTSHGLSYLLLPRPCKDTPNAHSWHGAGTALSPVLASSKDRPLTTVLSCPLTTANQALSLSQMLGIYVS